MASGVRRSDLDMGQGVGWTSKKGNVKHALGSRIGATARFRTQVSSCSCRLQSRHIFIGFRACPNGYNGSRPRE